VKKPVVTDSACLIGLERIGRLDVLPALFDPIIIPPEVQREFGGSLDWLQVRVPNNQALINALKLVVDDGEAEAIALAYEHHNLLILDDRQARSVAQRLTVPIIGTIGVLLLAKQAGILTSVASILIELESASFYVSDALKEEALRLAGE
jgi:predicted nucleic acid-binding protein